MQDDFFQPTDFTAGAQRALREAGRWAGCAASGELDAPMVLMGMLGEPDCRAASMLASHRIDVPMARKRWPGLSQRDSQPADCDLVAWRFSPDMETSIHLASTWLAENGLTRELATEHLLFGLVAAEHPVAHWLRHQGMTAECVESQLRALYGLPAVVISDECLDPPESEDDEPESCNDAPVPPLPPDSLPLPNDAPPPEAAGLPDRIGVLRALDAAANRGREGLRVVEDYVRFVLDDRNLTEQLKCFRHILTAALEPIPLEHRMAARETLADVGTDITTPSEQTRDAPEAVVAAGFARLQESLRSLEEFGKLLDQDIAAAFEQLRYEAYTLQRAVELTRISHGRLATAWLYVLLDGQASIEDFDLLARDLVLAGVHVLQLRDKKLGDGELLERASLLRELTAGSETLFIMNDRPDLALLAKADGVHVGQDDLPVKAVRSIVGPEMLIGVSTHSIEQARAAVLDGANYLGVGPVFPSKTKEFADFPGLDLVRAVSAEIRLPAFALGGIDQQNLPEVLEAGLNRVAVGAAVTASDNPATAVVELLKVLQ